jgi:hypothetical protein
MSWMPSFANSPLPSVVSVRKRPTGLRDVVRGLEAFRAELAELIAELRGDDAPLLH